MFNQAQLLYLQNKWKFATNKLMGLSNSVQIINKSGIFKGRNLPFRIICVLNIVNKPKQAWLIESRGKLHMHGLRLRILMIHYIFITLVLNTTYGSRHYHANLVRTIILVNDIFRDNLCMLLSLPFDKFSNISLTNKNRCN